MKKRILLLVVLCSLTSIALPSNAEVSQSIRGEIKLGVAYGLLTNMVPKIEDKTHKRLGIDSSFGIFARTGWLGFLTEVYFTGIFHNFNKDNEKDYSLFQFGVRVGLGPGFPMLTSRFNEIYLIPLVGLAAMSADTELGPAWNPQVGVAFKAGLFFARIMYSGTVAQGGERSSGFVAAAGLLFPSARLDDD